VLQDCNTYFDRRRYCRWFDQLVPILAACGGSYYDHSACHLDLVQWATDPTWRSLRPASLRKKLIADDARFLQQQLRNENIQLLLVNGTGTWRQLCRMASDLVIERQSQIGAWPSSRRSSSKADSLAASGLSRGAQTCNRPSASPRRSETHCPPP
jgi:hypothetical protein